MITYKLLRIKGGKLYPLFVETGRELPMGQWLEARVGELADANHVISPVLGLLRRRPGWHSTAVPLADWIGKKTPEGTLVQRRNTVWAECEVDGQEQIVTERNGLRDIPDGWYYYKTKPCQPFPWIISNRIKINRILSHEEVCAICREHGVEAQRMEE